MPSRQLVIIRQAEGNGAYEPLGEQREVLDMLASSNIAPDVPGGTFLYGPGITLQMPMTGDDEVNQLLCTLIEEDMAWAVLARLCPKHGWSMMDPESGQVLRF